MGRRGPSVGGAPSCKWWCEWMHSRGGGVPLGCTGGGEGVGFGGWKWVGGVNVTSILSGHT